MSQDVKATAELVSEEDLLKSLKELEGKAVEEKVSEPAKPKMVTAKLEKTVSDTVKENGTTKMRKALDVSEVLNEFVGVIGLHVDASLETLEKSINNAAERDMAIISVLGEMKKSIETLTAKVEAYGDTPAGKSKAVVTDSGTEVLEKSSSKGKNTEDETARGARARLQVSQGLELLAKSAEAGSAEQQGWINKAVKFETTGELSDIDAQFALGALKKHAPSGK